jgi:hypothetical protein
MASTNVLQMLRREEHQIQQQISTLQGQKEAVKKARHVLQGTPLRGGFKLFKNPVATSKKTKKTKSTKKKGSPKQMTFRGVNRPRPLNMDMGMSTMDMARTVLDNAKKELTAPEIHKGIAETFGKSPAASLTQMLYKRAKAGSSFYRGAKGTYGLLTWRGNKAAA